MYIIQLYKWKRWNKTIWTRSGKPVSFRAAKKALVRALESFPNCMYRIHEVK